MKTALIIIGTYTAAGKAASYLRRLGITVNVERTAGKNGCVFGLRTSQPPEKVCKLLKGAGISCGQVITPSAVGQNTRGAGKSAQNYTKPAATVKGASYAKTAGTSPAKASFPSDAKAQSLKNTSESGRRRAK